jgi:hypothetical protein
MKLLVRDIANNVVMVELAEVQSRLPPGWKIVPPDTANREKLELDLRSEPRYMLFGDMEVCDLTNSVCYNNAKIRDISESGLSIEPADTFVNDVRKFLINPIFLDDVQPFEFLAVCRWINHMRAGFEITSIAPSGMRELRKFIKLFCYEEF